jgi:hypothetical protein
MPAPSWTRNSGYKDAAMPSIIFLSCHLRPLPLEKAPGAARPQLNCRIVRVPLFPRPVHNPTCGAFQCAMLATHENKSSKQSWCTTTRRERRIRARVSWCRRASCKSLKRRPRRMPGNGDRSSPPATISAQGPAAIS